MISLSLRFIDVDLARHQRGVGGDEALLHLLPRERRSARLRLPAIASANAQAHSLEEVNLERLSFKMATRVS